jgi:hypothetical protein
MSVVIRRAETVITATASAFVNERELETILAEKVELLQASADRPLALVARQVNLLDAGVLDLLCVDSDGLPIAVEVKLTRNGESRRAVVAQIVDYLSALTAMTVDELDQEVDGKLEIALRTFDVDDEESFGRRWRTVGTNLRAGFARMIVAVDESPLDLQRIVRFLSEHSNLDIRLLAVSKFDDASVGSVYVPNVIVANEGEPLPRPDGRKETVPLDVFIQKWKSTAKPAAALAWEELDLALRSAGIEELRTRSYPSGAPYIALDLPIGSVRIMRLADPKVSPAELRDLLHAGSVWDSDPRAAAARDLFRNTICELVPGAIRTGAADRVYIPVENLLGRSAVLAAAIARLRTDLKVFKPD